MAASTALPGARVASPTKRARGVLDLHEAALAHLEDADVVGGAEAVLERPQRAVGALALALELQHAVDEVLEHARARERALLGDVADEQHRDVARLGQARDAVGDLAHLADRARRAGQVGRVQRLDRVDHAHLGALCVQRGEHGLEVGLRERRHVQRRAGQPLGPQADLGGGLLAGDVERAAARRPAGCRAPSRSASTCRCRASRRSARASRGRDRRRARGPAR